MSRRRDPVLVLWESYDHDWNRILESMTNELTAAQAEAEEEWWTTGTDTPVHDLFGPKAHDIMRKYGIGWKQR